LYLPASDLSVGLDCSENEQVVVHDVRIVSMGVSWQTCWSWSSAGPESF
jgi:hypothetical protein